MLQRAEHLEFCPSKKTKESISVSINICPSPIQLCTKLNIKEVLYSKVQKC